MMIDVQKSSFEIFSDVDRGLWRELLKNSEQSTVFCDPDYLEALGVNYALWGLRKPGEQKLSAGCVYVSEKNVPYLPYAGILFKKQAMLKAHKRYAHEFQFSQALFQALLEEHSSLQLPLSWKFEDLRPFLWHNYGQDALPHFEYVLRYTSVLNLKAELWPGMSENLRRNVRKAQKAQIKTVEGGAWQVFWPLYKQTFEKSNICLDLKHRKRVQNVFETMLESSKGLVFTSYLQDQPVSCSFFLKDRWRAYYLWGANHPDFLEQGAASLNLYDALSVLQDKGVSELDFVGANSPQRGFFKQKFNGQLRPYFVVSFESQKRSA